MFSGSYQPEDVQFLLKPVRLDATPVEEKERLIQSGQRHYSEMISTERLPSARYLEVFHTALTREKDRFAQDVLTLAHLVARARKGTVTLVSLARAGTPIGVLLGRALRRRYQRRVNHYSISIIRDRGIDEVALDYILSRHDPGTVAFVDGWTGKGVIASELRRAITDFNTRQGTTLDAGLFTVADLCGAAAWSATVDDYLIPSAILGATVSGLVSRSILNEAVVRPGDFHACLFYEEFRAADLSCPFVDEVEKRWAVGLEPRTLADRAEARRQRQEASSAFLDEIRGRYQVRDANHVKPGLGEATRVLLRRLPGRLLLREADHPAVSHLRLLAEEKNVPITVEPSLPYLACALIRELD